MLSSTSICLSSLAQEKCLKHKTSTFPKSSQISLVSNYPINEKELFFENLKAKDLREKTLL